MRHWHRWLGVCFALFILLIGTTGVAIQLLDVAAAMTKPDAAGAPPVTALTAASQPSDQQAHHAHHGDAVKAEGADSQGATAKPKPPQSPLRRWSHWIKDIHSGVAMGPVGIAISIVSGLVLMFFAVSGMWMYWQMFTRRRAAGRTNFFWRR